ncbi:MAG: SsrA-binding protein SmpB [Candidatus Abawacabacteria bacterium]|nr:SsrA-binding protein SmpB [Candidatus Abawacabacteria bacterium]
MSLAVNKKARFEYEILETFQAGIKLSGPEVKSVRAQNIQLNGAYIFFQSGRPMLLNAHISHYKPAYHSNAIADRSRELLLKKKEIDYLQSKIFTDKLTCIPLSVYLKNNLIKVEIALARGKKLHDKRRSIKERETDRIAARAMK